MTRDRYTHPLTTPLRAFVDTVLPNLGGTVALAGQPFPAAFEGSGIRPRDARRNLFLGTTITRPGTDECLIGFAYDDQKSGQTDEDLYRADRAKLTLRYFPGGRYERVNPDYFGTHHGAKDYLRTIPLSVKTKG